MDESTVPIWCTNRISWRRRTLLCVPSWCAATSQSMVECSLGTESSRDFLLVREGIATRGEAVEESLVGTRQAQATAIRRLPTNRRVALMFNMAHSFLSPVFSHVSKPTVLAIISLLRFGCSFPKLPKSRDLKGIMISRLSYSRLTTYDNTIAFDIHIIRHPQRYGTGLTEPAVSTKRQLLRTVSTGEATSSSLPTSNW